MPFKYQQIDLAAPQTQPQQPAQTQPVTVLPPITSDATVAAIAAVLASGVALGAMLTAVTAILAPYKIGEDAIKAALSLSMSGGIPEFQQADQGIVRYNGDGSINEGNELAPAHLVRLHDTEWNYRAMYFANASKRIWTNMEKGESLAEAVHDESRFYRQHVAAADMRGRAIARVQTVANVYGQQDENGTLVGWYLNPLLRNEPECVAANGNNFYAEHGTRIGYPGTVHQNCGCTAGPPHANGRMVDDALDGVVRLSKSKPHFKLKGA